MSSITNSCWGNAGRLKRPGLEKGWKSNLKMEMIVLLLVKRTLKDNSNTPSETKILDISTLKPEALPTPPLARCARSSLESLI